MRAMRVEQSMKPPLPYLTVLGTEQCVHGKAELGTC